VLKGVTKGKELPPGIVLYGPTKFGKSTFGSEAPNPIFIPTEDGVNNIKVDQFPRVTTWEELLKRIDEVLAGGHDYKTLVIDTLNGAVELAAQFVCQTKFAGDWGPKGFTSYGSGDRATSEEIRNLITRLSDVKAKGMTVLLLCHTGVQTVKNPVEGDYGKYAPDMPRGVWARFAAWADITMRGDYEFIVKKGPNPLAAGRPIGDSTRILRCSGSAAEDAGSRVGWELPDTLPFIKGEAWAGFEAAITKDHSSIEELSKLLAKQTKDKQEAAYTWLGTRNLERAPITKVRDLLTRLRNLGKTEEKEKKSNG